ncbi:hypothetical protein OsI_25313 [Oryza sativa Indica Group]|uniref:Uncharacterized protein n=1 Tax=Oryza sativa subsp. indica TaxID=39946 RepID=B8B888_ORYSI|nr:hypothetical protein OsI_25313 [Oryza sativa Indica Group]
MSQLPDAPQGTQPTQYNLRSTRAAKKREAEGGANHPGAEVGKGGASQCREAEGFRAGGGRRQLPWRRAEVPRHQGRPKEVALLASGGAIMKHQGAGHRQHEEPVEIHCIHAVVMKLEKERVGGGAVLRGGGDGGGRE